MVGVGSRVPCGFRYFSGWVNGGSRMNKGWRNFGNQSIVLQKLPDLGESRTSTSTHCET